MHCKSKKSARRRTHANGIQSYTVKVAPRSVVIIQFTIDNLLCQLSLPLSRFLSILEFETVLVHGEPHGLPEVSKDPPDKG